MKRIGVLLRIWLLALAACAAVVAFSFAHLDAPVAHYFAELNLFLRHMKGAVGGGLLVSGESVVLIGVVLVRLVRGRISVFSETLAIACLTSIGAYGVNDYVLKVFFGVPSPSNVLHGARHAFHFWMGSESSSFPSGHMVLAAAFAGVFMRLYRASIWALSLLLLLAAGLLIAGDWHFLSDIVAGTFFGLSAGALAAEGRAARSGEPQRARAG